MLVILIVVVDVTRPDFFSISGLLALLSNRTIGNVVTFNIVFTVLSGNVSLAVNTSTTLITYVATSLIRPRNCTGTVLPNINALPTPLIVLVNLTLNTNVNTVCNTVVTCAGVPPFVTALNTRLVYHTNTGVCAGHPISGLSRRFHFLNTCHVNNMFPVVVIIFFMVFTVSTFLLARAHFNGGMCTVNNGSRTTHMTNVGIRGGLVLICV